MTTASRLLDIVSDFRSRLLAQEQTAAAAMDAAHAQTLKIIERELDRLYDVMTEAIASGEPFSMSKLFEANRLETIKRLISYEIDQFGALARTMTGRLQEDGMHLGLDAAMQLMQVQVPVGISWSFGTPSMEALTQLVGSTQAGSPLARLFDGWGSKAASEIAQALISGVSMGNNPRAVARDIEQIMRAQVGETLREPRNKALQYARTEGNRAYRNASLATYRQNRDVVTKYRRTCAKNSRTCAPCIILDGTLYDLDKEFAIHPCDRCATIPVTRDWSEILGPLGIDTSNIPDTRPQIETGESWFNRQSEAIQRAVLGNAKYEAWKAGAFQLSNVVKHTHSPDWGDGIQEKSLKELVK